MDVMHVCLRHSVIHSLQPRELGLPLDFNAISSATSRHALQQNDAINARTKPDAGMIDGQTAFLAHGRVPRRH